MKNIPVSKVNSQLLLVVLMGIILYYARDFLIPLAFGILLAMLMAPVSNKLESWGFGRVWSTLVCILIFLLFVAGIFWIIAAQAASLSKDLPQIQVKLQQLIDAIQDRIQSQFDVTPAEQIKFVKSQIAKFSQSANKFTTSFLMGGFSLISSFTLTILYFFFLMWKREKYEVFFLRLSSPESIPEAKKQLHEITRVAVQYLMGRLISMVFLAVFYAVGFSLVGMKNALLISLVAVIPTIIPYIGSIIGGFFPLAMALLAGSSGQALPVIGILVAAQVIDNNIIEPLVEGASMNISPIMTIIAIVLGEWLWGVAGMILFIPMFAILRIICDHIPTLHAYGYLLANDVSEPRWLEKIKGWFGK